MQLFYSPNIDLASKRFIFDKDESRHILKVLRKKIGDELIITNGQGFAIKSKICTADNKKCEVEILEITKHKKAWDYHLHLAIAPTKNTVRYEWFLEKATEIGIDEITPIICGHSERKVLKTERLEKILETAMKQSLKFQVPKLNPICTFNDFIKKTFEGDLFIAHCENSKKELLKRQAQFSKNVTILIGPEGDFSNEEIAQALTKGFLPVSLGSSRLRTETAGLVAVQTIALLNQ